MKCYLLNLDVINRTGRREGAEIDGTALSINGVNMEYVFMAELGTLGEFRI